jgi:hypothetical protein
LFFRVNAVNSTECSREMADVKKKWQDIPFFFSLNPWFFFFKIDNGHIERKEDIKALEVKYMNTFAESISRVLCKMALPKDTYNSLPWLCFINRSRSTCSTKQNISVPPLYQIKNWWVPCWLTTLFSTCTLNGFSNTNNKYIKQTNIFL